MKNFILLLLNFLFLSNKSFSQVYIDLSNHCEVNKIWNLVFEDNFDGNSLNASKWTTFYPYGPNGSDNCPYCRTHGDEGQIYKDNNVIVANGILKLITKNEPSVWQGLSRNFTSGMIYSNQSFPNYSKFEIRCKLPYGRVWPAFWMFGGTTEIDVFEFFGGDKGFLRNSNIPNTFDQTIINWVYPLSTVYHYTSLNIDFSQDYHIFSVEYTKDIVKFFLDGVQTSQVNRFLPASLSTPVSQTCVWQAGYYNASPYFPIGNQGLQVIANVAVNLSSVSALGTSNVLPSEMDIDYIRVYELQNAPSNCSSSIDGYFNSGSGNNTLQTFNQVKSTNISINLTVNGNESISWQLTNGSPTSFTKTNNGNYAQISFNSNQSISYRLTKTSLGCASITKDITFSYSPYGYALVISPNPGASTVNLSQKITDKEINESLIASIKKISFMNVKSGQLEMEKIIEINSKTRSIDLNIQNLNKGNYVIKVVDENDNSQLINFIKQ